MDIEDSSSSLEINGDKNEVSHGGSEISEEKVKTPTIDMLFDNVKELHAYYKSYGKQMGFAVAKMNSRKSGETLTYYTVGCNKAGKSRSKSHNTFKPRPLTKTNCRARISAKLLGDGKWKVSNIVTEHNHLLSPGKSSYFASNRTLTSQAKRKLELNDKAGISMNRNYNSLLVEAGGPENLSFTEKDCRNYIEKVRRLKLGEGDVVALQSYFSKMQARDSKFFYAIDHNEDNRIRNVFWADGRCRAMYEEFGDVVSFDTTYLTNKYDMPFAPFVGVNHHGHSILLGCGLLSSEDTETFIWLFNTWLACMCEKAPYAIITDQDRAMKKGIEIVFPHARHRWCLWHIMKKYERS